MATSKIKQLSTSINKDVFVSGNANITIELQCCTIVDGNRPSNIFIYFTASADIPKYTSIVKLKDGYVWDGDLNYNFDCREYSYQRHPNRGTGVQNINVIPAGQHLLVFPY